MVSDVNSFEILPSFLSGIDITGSRTLKLKKTVGKDINIIIRYFLGKENRLYSYLYKIDEKEKEKAIIVKKLTNINYQKKKT